MSIDRIRESYSHSRRLSRRAWHCIIPSKSQINWVSFRNYNLNGSSLTPNLMIGCFGTEVSRRIYFDSFFTTRRVSTVTFTSPISPFFKISFEGETDMHPQLRLKSRIVAGSLPIYVHLNVTTVLLFSSRPSFTIASVVAHFKGSSSAGTAEAQCAKKTTANKNNTTGFKINSLIFSFARPRHSEEKTIGLWVVIQIFLFHPWLKAR